MQQPIAGRAGPTRARRPLVHGLALAALAALAACGGGGSSGPGLILPPPPAPAPSPSPSPAPAPAPADGPMVRQTAAGKIEGVDDSAHSGTYWWKGIPFAQAPEGALRWRAPVAPEPWEGVREAKQFGAACLQMGRIYGPGANNRYDETIGTTLGQPVGAEDCLMLNIWRPASTDKKLPVFVFAHGGSNVSGYTADPVYDGAALAKHANAVVVTVNYRLGLLGFLGLKQLRNGTDEGEDSGNYALLDILKALHYVQTNAEVFGGDAGNVTLSGQSAGAINILALLASPAAKGLFHRMLPISGGISKKNNLPLQLPPAQPLLADASLAREMADNILVQQVIADGLAVDEEGARLHIARRSDTQIATYLRGKDPKALLMLAAAKGLGGAPGPVTDGTLVPDNPIDEIKAGRYNKVPVVVAFTKEEGKLFAGGAYKINDAQRFALQYGYKPDEPPAVSLDQILPGSLGGYNAIYRDLMNAALIGPNRDSLLDALKSQQTDVWHYRFDWAQQPAPWNDIYGAAHGADLPFMFGNFGPSLFANVTNSTANREGRLALSNAMMASVGAFMRTGNPNNATLGTTWAPWPGQLLFDATPTQARITAEPNH